MVLLLLLHAEKSVLSAAVNCHGLLHCMLEPPVPRHSGCAQHATCKQLLLLLLPQHLRRLMQAATSATVGASLQLVMQLIMS
jgi:hypothetical protein